MKTAVKWLEHQLGMVERNLINKTFLDIKSKTLACNILRELFKQAKEMEKEQIINFGQEIVDNIAYDSQGKEWVADKYNETFKSE